MDDHGLRDALLQVERAGWESLCDSTGDVFYGDLMTDDAVMVLANGAVLDRDAVVASLAQAPPWRTFEIDDVRLVDGGADAATLVYRGTAYRDADEPAFVGIMASHYARRSGRWRLTHYQQTPLP